MISTRKAVYVAAISAIVVLPVFNANGSVIEASTMKKGVTFCGGNHFARNSGAEQSFTVWTLRNYSSKTINVNRVRVYDSNGVVIYDLPSVTPFPAGFKTALTARQTTSLNTSDFMANLPANQRPITIQINWQYAGGQRGIPMFTSVTRHFRATAGNGSLSSFGGSANCFIRAN